MIQYSIFLEHRELHLTPTPTGAPTEEGVESQRLDTLDDIPKVFQIFASTPRLRTLHLICENAHTALLALKARLKEIIACGGVVSDGSQILLIDRLGRPDLPKGKREHAESLEQCALREVREETGYLPISIQRPLQPTIHCYPDRDGTWAIKTTYWFSMRALEPHTLAPQHEEGITAAYWVRAQDIPALLPRVYPTVASVIREHYQMQRPIASPSTRPCASPSAHPSYS